jgi:hypothetical protein
MGKFKEMDLLRQEREQALDKMAENARELGLNYDTPLSAFVRSSDEDKAEVMERVIDKAIEAQKKAQPAPVQEPVESPDDWSDWKVTPPAQPAPVQEPVAWMDASGNIYQHELWPDWNPPHTPLYVTPPAAQPAAWVGLTDEQIAIIYKAWQAVGADIRGLFWGDFVREITLYEAARGITEGGERG